MSLICHGSTSCSAAEVGPFMQGISVACGNNGDCQLGDIMSVVANVGNYVLGLVGAVVLLMFVIGGFYMVASGGNMDRVKTGKRYITTSVIGLLIVFGAFAAIQTLKGVLTGTTASPANNNFVLCTDPSDDGKACGLNMICQGLVCTSQCDISHPAHDYACTDKADPTASSVTTGQCEPNKCPGGDTIQCCKVR
jgi:hypothetical protein